MFDIPKAWLHKQVSVTEVEDDIKNSELFVSRWNHLKAGLQPGDEVWSFVSPADTWKHLTGRAGYVIVREGRLVDGMVTMMN
jgi:hypothetical protein